MSSAASRRRVRQETRDDVSFSPPREPAREWTGDESRVVCRNSHPLNYVLTLQQYREAYDQQQYAGEARLFVRCKTCGSRQMGQWSVSTGDIEWFAIPSEACWEEVTGLCGKTPTAAVVEIIRQRWNNA